MHLPDSLASSVFLAPHLGGSDLNHPIQESKGTLHVLPISPNTDKAAENRTDVEGEVGGSKQLLEGLSSNIPVPGQLAGIEGREKNLELPVPGAISQK